MKTFDVVAHWDAEANVWWADSDQIPGLATEAPTHERLDKNIRFIAPELLNLNLGYTYIFAINLIRAEV